MRPLEVFSQHKLIRRLISIYADLESNDRYALMGLALFFGLLIVVLGIWQPAADYAASARVTRNNQQELINWMNSTAVQARAAAGIQTTTHRSGQSLLTTISRTAQDFKIKPNKMQPEGNDEVSVWFDAVAFNSLMTWLEELQANQGILVRQISVDKNELPGTVNARIILKS